MAIPGDPYWDSVTLLLHADATVGTGTTLDVSPTPKTVTAVSAATISSADKMFGDASMQITAPGYFLVNDAYPGGLLNTDFTIECWCRTTSSTQYASIWHIDGGTSGQYSGLIMSTTGLFGSTSGSTWNLFNTPPTNITANQWYHVAVCRQGPTVYLFRDGVLQGTYNIGTASVYAANPGRLWIGQQATSGQWNGFIDEFRITKGVARYTSDFTPEGPFPDNQVPTPTTVSSLTLEAVGKSSIQPAIGVRAKAAAKQVLLQATPTVTRFQLEAVTRDTSFIMPRDLRARGGTKTVMLAVTPRVYGYQLEAVGSAATVLPGDLRARSNTKQALLSATPQASQYMLEAVAEHSGFVIPGDTKLKAAAKQVLLGGPKDISNSDYRLEAVGYGNTPTPSSLFTLEAVVGLPYSTPIHNFTLEAIAESTITPPRPQTVAVWFTVVDP